MTNFLVESFINLSRYIIEDNPNVMNSIASKISAVNKCSVKNDACNIDDELIEPRLHTNYLLCSKMQQMTQSGPNV